MLFRRKTKESGATEPSEQPSFAISSLTFNEDTQLDLETGDMLVLVGPNNVGKTATLKEILQLLRGKQGTILRKLTAAKSGDGKAIATWMEQHYTQDAQVYWRMYRLKHCSIQASDIASGWQKPHTLGELTDFICRFVATEERLQASRPAENLDALSEACREPMQLLVANPEFEVNLSKATFQAFGIPVFLDRWAGKRICIRCGSVPEGQPWTPTFLREVRARLSLEEQGDGMRSFTGCILEGVLAPHMVMLIDEPEAFLHPQHARVLGRMLAAAKPANHQVFLATHSVHFLLGLLDSGASKIRVVRLRRDGDRNPIRELKHEQIKEVWEDPLLRASNVLEGIFHDRVVVCEGDSDCRFYSCVLDALIGLEEAMRRPDVMFTSCGGKARMPLVIRALKALDVPVQTVVDFDVLEHGRDLQAVVESYGHRWAEIEPEWKSVNQSLKSVAPALSLAQVKSSIEETLRSETGPHLVEQKRKELMDLLRTASPWAAAKRAGRSCLPSGTPTSAYAKLTGKLRSMGIFIVDCGELERFVPSVGTHGPGWVTEVLRRDLAKDPEIEEARRFVRELAGI